MTTARALLQRLYDAINDYSLDGKRPPYSMALALAMRETLAFLATPEPQGEPVAGWRMVPVEPTPEMIEKGLRRIEKARPQWADEYTTGVRERLRNDLALDYREMINAAPPAATTQGGWVLVPKEPTQEMIDAGWIDKEDVTPREIWIAMRNAAPPAESDAEDAARTKELLEAAVWMLAEWCYRVDKGGASWDEWDESYKDAAYRPGPLRELIDAAMKEVAVSWGDAPDDDAARRAQAAQKGERDAE